MIRWHHASARVETLLPDADNDVLQELFGRADKIGTDALFGCSLQPSRCGLFGTDGLASHRPLTERASGGSAVPRRAPKAPGTRRAQPWIVEPGRKGRARAMAALTAPLNDRRASRCPPESLAKVAHTSGITGADPQAGRKDSSRRP